MSDKEKSSIDDDLKEHAKTFCNTIEEALAESEDVESSPPDDDYEREFTNIWTDGNTIPKEPVDPDQYMREV